MGSVCVPMVLAQKIKKIKGWGVCAERFAPARGPPSISAKGSTGGGPFGTALSHPGASYGGGGSPNKSPAFGAGLGGVHQTCCLNRACRSLLKHSKPTTSTPSRAVGFVTPPNFVTPRAAAPAHAVLGTRQRGARALRTSAMSLSMFRCLGCLYRYGATTCRRANRPDLSSWSGSRYGP